MTTPLDPLSYMRLPKLDVASALGLGKILIHRVPKGSSPAVRRAASTVENAVDELESKWMEQVLPLSRNDLRPLAHRLAGAWSSIRDRLITYASFPEGNRDRSRAIAIHDVLFPDGLVFLKLTAIREYGESERRIRLVDERGLAKDIARLAGDRFLAALRAAHEAFGDALGINKASPLPAAPVVVVELLRALTDAISRYALQLVALAHDDPEKRDAIALALAPIDEFRSVAGRRAVADEDEDIEVEVEVEPAANAPTEADPQATGTN
jgi:hypothetical protein